MRRTVLSLMLLTLAACQPPATELTEEQKAQITAEVRQLDTEFWNAWREADWDRGMAFYYDSPDFVWAADGIVTMGLDKLEALRPDFANVASQTFTFMTTRLVVMASDAVSMTALGTWTQTDTTGVTGPPEDFAWTAVWVRRDGEWKIHLVHMSNPTPG
jgi:ketosteroid isomerase-like protein